MLITIETAIKVRKKKSSRTIDKKSTIRKVRD